MFFLNFISLFRILSCPLPCFYGKFVIEYRYSRIGESFFIDSVKTEVFSSPFPVRKRLY